MRVQDINIKQFSTMQELLCLIQDNIGVSNYYDLHKRRKIDSESNTDIYIKFSKTNSIQDAIMLAKNGCADIIQKIDSNIRDYQRIDNYNQKTKRYYNDTKGFIPNIPLYLNNIPNCMINQRVEYKKNTSNVVHIIINNTFSCTYSADDIIKIQSEKIKSIIDMEKDGYKTNLYLFMGVKMQMKNQILDAIGLCVKIKNSNDYLNLARLSFPLCHPSMLRRIFFKFTEVEVHKKYTTDRYGFVIQSNEDIKEVLKNKVHIDYIM